MSTTGKIAKITIPFLHQALYAKQNHAENVLDSPEQWTHRLCGLVMSEREVRVTLTELQAMDSALLNQAISHVVNDMHKTLTAQQQTTTQNEKQALDAFVNTHGNSAHPPTSQQHAPNILGQDENALRLRAQHLLLMDWVQEERVLEIKQLAQNYTKEAIELAELFSDQTLPQPDAQKASEELQTISSLNTDVETLLFPWEFVLAQLSWFLPHDVLLVVGSPLLYDSLQEHGQSAQIPATIKTLTDGEQLWTCPLRPLLGMWAVMADPKHTDRVFSFVIPSTVIAESME